MNHDSVCGRCGGEAHCVDCSKDAEYAVTITISRDAAELMKALCESALIQEGLVVEAVTAITAALGR